MLVTVWLIPTGAQASGTPVYPTLDRGSRGEDVDALQHLRNNAGVSSETTVLIQDPSGTTVVLEGDWIRRTWPDRLERSNVRVIQGVPEDGVCVFSGEEYVPPDAEPPGTVTVEREIAFNPRTCTMLLERGRVNDASARTQGADAEVWQKLAYKDPVNLDVNWIKSDQLFSFNGSCVTWQWTNGTRGWLTATGWFPTSWDTASSGLQCTPYVWFRTSGSFKNWLFCDPLKATRTQYYYNTVRGYPYGGKGYSWSAVKSGDCSILLSFHRTRG